MDRDDVVPFVQYLERLRENDDRGALAVLRRGLGKSPGESPGMYRYVVPWVGAEANPWQEEVYYTIASLFASHPQPGGEGSVGNAFYKLMMDKGGESTERRFIALLNCHADELKDHLRHVVSLLKSRNIPVHWHRLFRDLSGWRHPHRYVQKSWARDFWGTTVKAEEDAPQTETSSNIGG